MIPPSTTPYCGAPPGTGELLGRWNLDPVLLAGIGLCAALAWRLAGPGLAPGRQLGAALLLALLLFVSPLCALTSALFSARVLHHVLLVGALAPLLAMMVPPNRLPGTGQVAAWTALQAMVFWAWHAPPLYERALSSDSLYWVMQLSLLASSIGFWLSLRRSAPTGAVAALLATVVQMGLLGALLTFAGQPLYAPHFASTAQWGLSPLEDQQLAGLIMWAPAAGLYLAGALLITARWLRAERLAA